MCLVERDIYRNAGKILYVSHYLPEHEIKKVLVTVQWFSKKLRKFFTFRDFVNALFHEPLVRMTSDFMCGYLLLWQINEKVFITVQ